MQAGILRRSMRLVCLLVSVPCFASVSVPDDTGQAITLASPARRIVSLAPHTTEMLFAAGAGPYIVGVTEFSDHPPPARAIPSVGSGVSLDLERILQMKPDLIVGWNNGYAGVQLDKLQSLGIPVFRSEPYDFATIASSLERLARLSATEPAGRAAAAAFRERLGQLRETYRQRRRLGVFYQIWRTPLMTLGGSHLVSAALRTCGADNVFSDLKQLAPTVTIEAVLKANPDVIVASSGEEDDVLAVWKRFPRMKAVANDNLLVIDSELLNRAGPRILDGVEMLCRKLDAIRMQSGARR
ncbi:cobalamin-binding protein [Noviherbaspirillum sp. CPCC 100848]|uniref:Cobalamin-binding protein n=1 Tax=Noviherbaspirillum album TaxID=3080276 RepID=A0ABU6JFC9_9BURK|nr:cobalamin-binding protein [Noviherbaspirillum sp. CPCC 100848]MEC4722166.1 cobalamin-binding protein [Noviherbaspirillum sp. CPCC 100848]